MEAECIRDEMLETLMERIGIKNERLRSGVVQVFCLSLYGCSEKVQIQ